MDSMLSTCSTGSANVVNPIPKAPSDHSFIVVESKHSTNIKNTDHSLNGLKGRKDSNGKNVHNRHSKRARGTSLPRT
jgi:hypothetical protein